MLLGQCLAISLSEESGEADSGDDAGASVSPEARDAGDGHKTATSGAAGRRLFERLAARNRYANSGRAVGENDPLSAGRRAISREVYYALKRTHLAGFFEPNWLLLSGALDDLQAIRSCWAAGLLLAPDGMRIDAIGKCPALSSGRSA